MPLFPGREWCYDVEGYAPITADSGVWNYEHCDSIESVHDINGEHWYSLADKLNIFSHYMTNRADGLWSGSSGGIVSGVRMKLLFPFPAEIGTSLPPDTNDHRMVDSSNGWYEYYDTVAGAVTLVEKDVILKVPAGWFACYHYQKEMRNIRTGVLYSREDNYYAVNIGLIQSEIYRTDSVGTPISTHLAKLKRMNWR